MGEEAIIKEYLNHFFTYEELALYLNIDKNIIKKLLTDYNHIENLLGDKTSLKVRIHTNRIKLWNEVQEEKIVNISQKEEEIIRIANSIIENGYSIREASKQFGKGRTTIHDYMTEELPEISIILYKKVFDVMMRHKSLSVESFDHRINALEEFELLKQGYTIKEIAAKTGRSRNQVQRDLADRLAVINPLESYIASDILEEHKNRLFNRKN